jgi:hypothetical protein
MKPHRFLMGLLTGLLLGAGGWAGLIFYQWDVPARPDSGSNEFALAKRQMARQAPSPKIMIFAGSNARFGLEAELIGRALGQPCLNMAINVGLPLRYFFYQIRQTARPGDTVILALEYDYFFKINFTDVFINQVLTQEPEVLAELELGEKIEVLLAARFEDLWSRAWRKGRPPEQSSLQHVRLFSSPCGDALLSSEKSPGYRSRALLRAEMGQPVLTTESRRRTQTWEEMKALRQWCEAHGVRLLATYPSIYAFPSFTQPDHRDFFNWLKQSYREAGVPVLGEPEDSMYDFPSLFENGSHIVSEVRESRTLHFIELLKPIFGVEKESWPDDQGFYNRGTRLGWTTGEASIPLTWKGNSPARAVEVAFSAINPRRRQVEIWWNQECLFQGPIQTQHWQSRLPLPSPVPVAAGGVLRILNRTSSSLGTDRLPLGVKLDFAALMKEVPVRPLLPTQREDYRSQLKLSARPVRMSLSRPLDLQIEVENQGEATWPEAASVGVEKAVRVAFEWFTDRTKEPLFPGSRVELPVALSPGRKVTIPFVLNGPLDGNGRPYPPGHYDLRISLVQECVVWFHRQGDNVIWLSLDLEP